MRRTPIHGSIGRPANEAGSEVKRCRLGRLARGEVAWFFNATMSRVEPTERPAKDGRAGLREARDGEARGRGVRCSFCWRKAVPALAAPNEGLHEMAVTMSDGCETSTPMRRPLLPGLRILHRVRWAHSDLDYFPLVAIWPINASGFPSGSENSRSLSS